MNPDAASLPSEPLYRQVGHALLERIQAGDWAVGDVLPKEVDLARMLDVSRATLRQALDILEKGGVVQRVRKIGTRVVATTLATRYVQRMDGLDNILRLAGQTAMRIGAIRTVSGVPDEGLRGVPSATGYWLAVEGARHLQGQDALSTWTVLYLDNKYAGVVPFLTGEIDAVYTLVERVYDVAVHSIRHRIGACAATADVALALGLPTGSPCLEVQAWLHASDGSLIEFVRSIHNPALIAIELTSTRDAP